MIRKNIAEYFLYKKINQLVFIPSMGLVLCASQAELYVGQINACFKIFEMDFFTNSYNT